MLGIVKEIDGQKTIIPLTTDTGTGAPVGTLIQQYKKKPMSGYLYCDGSTFDQNAYPALYMYLGSNVLPDYRECVMVGAEQNTTDTIAAHDVYGEGEFKDDQLQRITGSFEVPNRDRSPEAWGAFSVSSSDKNWFALSETVALPSLVSLDSAKVARTGDTNTTHGKQKAVYVYIKATSGLAENQQDNVLNDVKDYVDNSNSYSTQEVKTGGKWIDGKPIYRKAVEVSSLPNNTQISYSHDIVNVDSFVTVRGIAKSKTLSLPIPFVERDGTANIQIYAQASGFDISTNYDASSYACTIIFEYTKTTD